MAGSKRTVIGDIEVGPPSARPVVSGQLPVRARGDHFLVVGHGDARSVHVRAQAFRGGRGTSKRLPPYKAYALDAEGRRQPLEAHGVVVEVGGGVEVEIDFAPHPNFAGHLVMFTPQSGRRMGRAQEQGIYDDFAIVFGSSNVLHVWVERRARKSRS